MNIPLSGCLLSVQRLGLYWARAGAPPPNPQGGAVSNDVRQRSGQTEL